MGNYSKKTKLYPNDFNFSNMNNYDLDILWKKSYLQFK